MPPKVATALAAVLVVAVPVILVGNAVWLLLGPWFVEFQYALPGFPADPAGLGDPQRAELAKTGVGAVRPIGEGVELLREARLPGGEPAFDEREVSHMADVRGVMAGLLIVWGIALACAVAAGLALRRLGQPGSARRALCRGALLTVAGMALLGVFMAVAFDTFFDAFHGLLFEDGTWRFDDSATLRRLYPDAFWGVAGATVAVLVLAQAAALLAGLRDAGPARPRYGRRATPRM